MFWFLLDHPDGLILGNGTVTFLQTPERLLGVTAAHVVRGYEVVRRDLHVGLQLGNATFEDLRVIAISDRLDIAVLDLGADFLAIVGQRITPFGS